MDDHLYMYSCGIRLVLFFLFFCSGSILKCTHNDQLVQRTFYVFFQVVRSVLPLTQFLVEVKFS